MSSVAENQGGYPLDEIELKKKKLRRAAKKSTHTKHGYFQACTKSVGVKRVQLGVGRGQRSLCGQSGKRASLQMS